MWFTGMAIFCQLLVHPADTFANEELEQLKWEFVVASGFDEQPSAIDPNAWRSVEGVEN